MIRENLLIFSLAAVAKVLSEDRSTPNPYNRNYVLIRFAELPDFYEKVKSSQSKWPSLVSFSNANIYPCDSLFLCS